MSNRAENYGRPESIIVVRTLIPHAQDKRKFLLLKRNTALHNNKGLWECSGGKKDKTDINLAATAEREAREETGLSVVAHEPNILLSDYVINDGSAYDGWQYTCLGGIAIWVGGTIKQLSQAEEHTDSHWLTATEANRLDLTRESAKLIQFYALSLQKTNS